MTRDKVRAAARNVDAYFEAFRSVFGRPETQTHARVYLKGLLSNMRRKTCEAIAMRFAETKDGAPCAEKEVVAMQSFITQGKWPADQAMRKVQAAFAKELVPSCRNWSIGTVGVTPDGTCPLDQQLFLPEAWTKDKTRRCNTQVPEEITYQSKPEIAAEMIGRTQQAGHVKLDWITGDSLYGSSGPLRAALEAAGQRYVLAVRPNLTVWVADPGNRTTVTLGTKQRKKHGTWRHPNCRSLKELGKDLPADAWQAMQLREGSKGPLVYEFARMRVWIPREGWRWW